MLVDRHSCCSLVQDKKILPADGADCNVPHSTNRCKLEKVNPSGPAVWKPKNGGTVLSEFACEHKENRDGKGPAVLQDAPMAYLDPHDGVLC